MERLLTVVLVVCLSATFCPKQLAFIAATSVILAWGASALTPYPSAVGGYSQLFEDDELIKR